MDHIEAKAALIGRVEAIYEVLRHQNSGAYIHEVINMRHITCWLLTIPDEELVSDQTRLMIGRLENRLVDYLKRRYDGI